ncbi:hypothetical protein C0993_004768, partial [Termitomyces sp. T159_Od127]
PTVARDAAVRKLIATSSSDASSPSPASSSSHASSSLARQYAAAPSRAPGDLDEIPPPKSALLGFRSQEKKQKGKKSLGK